MIIIENIKNDITNGNYFCAEFSKFDFSFKSDMIHSRKATEISGIKNSIKLGTGFAKQRLLGI